MGNMRLGTEFHLGCEEGVRRGKMVLVVYSPSEEKSTMCATTNVWRWVLGGAVTFILAVMPGKVSVGEDPKASEPGKAGERPAVQWYVKPKSSGFFPGSSPGLNFRVDQNPVAGAKPDIRPWPDKDAEPVSAASMREAGKSLDGGNAEFDRGNVDLAISHYDMALFWDPHFYKAYNRRGLAYLQRGDVDKALADFTKAIALEPKNTAAYHNRGGVYYLKRDFGKALADFNEVVGLDPQSSEAYRYRGLAYSKLGKERQAEEDLRGPRSLTPPSSPTPPRRKTRWRRASPRRSAGRSTRPSLVIPKRFGSTRD